MSDLVDHDRIEEIVGVPRHPVWHQARAVSEEETVYVLHPQACLDRHLAGERDLRACPFSEALDRGIDLGAWGAHQDVALRVGVHLDQLVPWHAWMDCPACTGTVRETVGMVCQSCGTNYGVPQ